jgi:hypothetical protein
VETPAEEVPKTTATTEAKTPAENAQQASQNTDNQLLSQMEERLNALQEDVTLIKKDRDHWKEVAQTLGAQPAGKPITPQREGDKLATEENPKLPSDMAWAVQQEEQMWGGA